jgi:hypothetical protein
MAAKKEKIKKDEIDTHSYKGWLNSDSFMKRAFACLGYQFVAGLTIYGILLGVFLVIMVFVAIILGIVGIFS